VFDAEELAKSRTLRNWCTGGDRNNTLTHPPPTSIFDSHPLDKCFSVGAGSLAVDSEMQAAVEQSIIQDAIERSKQDELLLLAVKQAEEDEEARLLSLALAASQQEDREMQHVIELSRVSSSAARRSVVEILSSDDEYDARGASACDVACSHLFEMGFTTGLPARAFSFSFTCYPPSCSYPSSLLQLL
jgi:hypothetical protein